MELTKVKIFFKNFTALRKSFVKNILMYAGAILAVHEVIEWILSSELIASFFKSVTLSGISVYWLLSEPWLYIVAVALMSVITQSRLSKFSEKICNDSGCEIEISMGDIFKNPGAILVPCNNIFASDLKIIGKSSIQAQMTERIVLEPRQRLSKDERIKANEEYVAAKIREQLSLNSYNERKVSERIRKFEEYPDCKYQIYEYGTVVKITANVDRHEREIHLLAMSYISSPGTAHVDNDALLENIDKMWDYFIKNKTGGTMVIPVMGTGAANTQINKQIVARYILSSYAKRTKQLSIKKLILSIYPGDYIDNHINLEELREYAKLICKYPEDNFKLH